MLGPQRAHERDALGARLQLSRAQAVARGGDSSITMPSRAVGAEPASAPTAEISQVHRVMRPEAGTRQRRAHGTRQVGFPNCGIKSPPSGDYLPFAEVVDLLALRPVAEPIVEIPHIESFQQFQDFLVGIRRLRFFSRKLLTKDLFQLFPLFEGKCREVDARCL
jgi:hypothetical protein